MRFALGLLISALASTEMACRGPTITEYDLDISLPDSVLAKRSPTEVNLTIGIKLTNHDTEIVFYDDCGHALQKHEGNEWRAIWSPPCRSSGLSYALNPGESHLFTFTRRMAATATEWPAVNAAGEYRVVLWLTATPQNQHGIRPEILGPTSRTSPVFGVREVVVVF